MGITLLVALGALLTLPLTSNGGQTRLSDQVRGGLDRTVNNVNTVAQKVREQQRKLREQLERERRRREAAKRAQAAPRQASPGPQGTAYVPPMHGANPHGQGTAASQELPPQSARPQPNDPTGPGELLVVGRSRGEQLDNGTYRGHITIAALAGNDIVPPVTTNQGETKPYAPLASILTPICTGTQICLTALNATSTTTASGSTNRYSTATASVGGTATGVNTGVATSNGNISEDASCQTSRGDSNVADARVGGPTGLSADAIEATSTSRKCKDGTQSQVQTSKVVNLQNAGLAVPPLVSQACANGVPDTPALVNILLPAVCNADDANSSQAGPVNGVREGLTAFVLDIGGNALTKTTTAAAESRAVKNPQCSDGVDNDGDGRIDFPADPGCTSSMDDSEQDSDGGGRRGADEAACADGIDNDGDGRIDFPADPGCTSARDDSEAGGGTECSDRRDNDGDGLVDFPNDPGCSSAADDSEAGGGGAAGAGAGGGGPECSDGVDNDGDGKVDFPNDPQCSSESDDSEADGAGGGRLAFTGTNIVLAGLIGSLLLLTGLLLRTRIGARGVATTPAQRRSGLAR